MNDNINIRTFLINRLFIMLSLAILLISAAAVSARLDDNYIVGGDRVTVGKWPVQASLLKYGSHTCGGSLLTTTWILTAAHCVSGSARDYSVKMGMHDQAGSIVTPQRQTVRSYIVHPNYIPSGNYPNDIALVNVNQPFTLDGKYVKLAVLAPDDNEDYAGNTCYISGWGLERDGGPVAPILNEAKVDVPTNNACRYYWGSSITSGHICIFDTVNKAISACSGDSGGPLHCMRNGQYHVVGVASWVAGGCNPTYPGAYTRVSEYRDWIDTNIRN